MNNIVLVSYIIWSVLGGVSRVNMMNGRLVVLCLAASGLGAGVATFCVMTAMKQEALPQATQSAVSEACYYAWKTALQRCRAS